MKPLTNGNMKLGTGVLKWSLEAGDTCPGASTWCSDHCYGKKGFFYSFSVKERHAKNQALLVDLSDFERRVNEQLSHARIMEVRIHEVGDFWSVPYTMAWIRIVQANPTKRFWGYTRSWTIPDLVPALEELRSLPNMQLFASCDTSMPDPPKGWRIAWIDGDPRATGVTCLFQQKLPDGSRRKDSCSECGFCQKGRSKNVVFLPH